MSLLHFLVRVSACVSVCACAPALQAARAPPRARSCATPPWSRWSWWTSTRWGAGEGRPREVARGVGAGKGKGKGGAGARGVPVAGRGGGGPRKGAVRGKAAGDRASGGLGTRLGGVLGRNTQGCAGGAGGRKGGLRFRRQTECWLGRRTEAGVVCQLLEPCPHGLHVTPTRWP